MKIQNTKFIFKIVKFGKNNFDIFENMGWQKKL